MPRRSTVRTVSSPRAASAGVVAAATAFAALAGPSVHGQSAAEPEPEPIARVASAAAFDVLDLRSRRGYVGDQPGLDAVTPGRWLPEPDGDDPWVLTAEAFGQYTDAGDLESDAGDVSVMRGGIDVRLDAAAIGELDWSLTLGYEHSSYDFTTGSSPLIGGTSDLVDDVLAFDVSWDFTLPLDEAWSLWGGVGALVAGESGADVGDMVNVGGRFGVAWRASDELALGFGAFVREDLAEGVEVLPVFLVDWRFAEDWTLSLEGTQTELAWTPSDELRLAAFLAFEFRLYALADDGVVANGAFNEDRFVLGLAADWRPADDVLLRGAIGAVVSQEFDVEDPGGEDVVSIEGDSTGLVASLGLTIRF